MRFDGNAGTAPNYEPNSVRGTPAEAPAYCEPSWNLGATVVERFGHISASMKAVTRSDIVQRQLEHFELVDPRLAAGISKRLEI